MNNIIDGHTPQTVAGTFIFAVSAAFATGQVPWPEKTPPFYEIPEGNSSYSPYYTEHFSDNKKTPNSLDFGREISELYEAISTGQEPLGIEFETVWNENIESLYES